MSQAVEEESDAIHVPTSGPGSDPEAVTVEAHSSCRSAACTSKGPLVANQPAPARLAPQEAYPLP